MSRDFTPRQSLFAEEYTGTSLWSIMENGYFSCDGEKIPFCDSDELAVRKQYPLLGKLINNFSDMYAELAGINGGLNVLRNKDNELAAYVDQKKGDPESYLIRWFEGKLDKNFYYSERNEEMFCEELIKEAKEKEAE